MLATDTSPCVSPAKKCPPLPTAGRTRLVKGAPGRRRSAGNAGSCAFRACRQGSPGGRQVWSRALWALLYCSEGNFNLPMPLQLPRRQPATEPIRPDVPAAAKALTMFSRCAGDGRPRKCCPADQRCRMRQAASEPPASSRPDTGSSARQARPAITGAASEAVVGRLGCGQASRAGQHSLGWPAATK